MRIALFDTKDYDIISFNKANKEHNHEIVYFEEDLTKNSVKYVKDFDAVCCFVNTYGNAEILDELKRRGVKYWLQRSMGYNKVDIQHANKIDLKIFRVFNYSAESVAEHAMGLLLALNRNFIKAYKRVHNFNFTLNGLQGKCLQESTIGVIGAGKIGQAFIKIAKGFGSKVLAYDDFLKAHHPEVAQQLGFSFASLDELLSQSDFISLHAPLLNSTRHIINKQAISKMKKGVILVNAARGPLINLTDAISGLKSQKIRAIGFDVLEREEGRFFHDLSHNPLQVKEDSEWMEILSMDNVFVTSHQAYFTDLSLSQIAKFTLENADMAQNNDFSKTLVYKSAEVVING